MRSNGYILSLVLMLSLQPLCAIAQTEVSGSLTAQVIQKQQLGYALHIPKNTKEKKALIIFLHGDGEKGTNLEKVKIHGPFKYLKTHPIDAYVLAPQCPEHELWNAEMIYQLVVKIQREYPIDAHRIYLTGLSSGGWATWNLALAHPDLFAAIVPISSFVDLVQLDDICKIKAIPTRIYHGLLDDVVPLDYAASIYKNLKNCNPNIGLTIFDDAGHDSWSRVYDNAEIYDWMLKQTKHDPKLN
ncbi:MAG TPA: prolyl oligopeptidase family serine peptidase [Flavobacterium sp.]|nr:prolyl oligopeptidase family serine peptidase [Flavobacterium sp.]HPJ10941.1 prolyl oligopeptidase family serine peptidase [Flavobacterium sp.]